MTSAQSTKIPFRVRCDSCRWTGYRNLVPGKALTYDIASCPRCDSCGTVKILSPKVSR